MVGGNNAQRSMSAVSPQRILSEKEIDREMVYYCSIMSCGAYRDAWQVVWDGVFSEPFIVLFK